MTQEFDHVRRAFAGSAPGRGAAAIGNAMSRAWQTSRSGDAVRSTARAIAALPEGARTRMIAIAVIIAALAQPLLIRFMPATVVPALPLFAYLIVAAVAAVTAWHADALASAWPSSRLRRWLRG